MHSLQYIIQRRFGRSVAGLLLFVSIVSMLAIPVVSYANPAPRDEIMDAVANPKADAVTTQMVGCNTNGDAKQFIIGCLSYLAYWIMKGTVWIAGVMSVILNYALMELVVGMGLFVANIPGILIAWQALRDVVTVFLVFLTLFIGIATILNVSGYGYKNLLIKVILAALFVNFSITLTKVVIDVANIAATEVYALLLREGSKSKEDADASVAACLGGQVSFEADDNGPYQKCLNRGIAAAFWTKLKITQMINPDGSGIGNGAANMSVLVTFIMASFMFLVLAYVLGVGAMMLVARFIILVLLIIVSPIGLVAWITGMSGQGSKWWHTLINQATIAPLLLFMWWVSLQILTGIAGHFQLADKGGKLAGDVLMSTGGLSIVINFLIVMGFLLASLHFASSLGNSMTNSIMGGMKRAGRGALGVAGVAGAGAAVYGGGFISSVAADKYRNAIARAQEIDTNTGKHVNSGIGARLIRGSGVATAFGGKIDRGLQRAISAPSRSGVGKFKSYRDADLAVAKARTERAEELSTQAPRARVLEATKQLAKHREGSYLSAEKRKEYEKTIKGASVADLEYVRAQNQGTFIKDRFNSSGVTDAMTRAQLIALAKNSSATPEEKKVYLGQAYKQERELLTGILPDPNETGITAEEKTKRQSALDKRNEDLGLAVRSMSIADYQNNKKLLLGNPESAQYFSPEMMAKIIETEREAGNHDVVDTLTSGKTTDANGNTVYKGRYGSIYNAMQAVESARNAKDGEAEAQALATYRKAVRSLDNKDLELVGGDAQNNPLFAGALSPTQYEHLTKTKRSLYAPSQIQGWNDARRQTYLDMLKKSKEEGASEDYKRDVAEEFAKLGPKGLAGLDKDVLMEPEFLKHLDMRTANEVLKSNVNKEVVEKLRANLEEEYENIKKRLTEARNEEAVRQATASAQQASEGSAAHERAEQERLSTLTENQKMEERLTKERQAFASKQARETGAQAGTGQKTEAGQRTGNQNETRRSAQNTAWNINSTGDVFTPGSRADRPGVGGVPAGATPGLNVDVGSKNSVPQGENVSGTRTNTSNSAVDKAARSVTGQGIDEGMLNADERRILELQKFFASAEKRGRGMMNFE
jgi:hypothetical protein